VGRPGDAGVADGVQQDSVRPAALGLIPGRDRKATTGRQDTSEVGQRSVSPPQMEDREVRDGRVEAGVFEGQVLRVKPFNPLDVLDSALTAWRAGAFQLNTWTLYTSGTTGRPKGAILSNGALAARMHYMALEYAIRPGDAFLQTLPMAHIAAYNCLPIAYVGATNVMLRTYDTRRAVEALVRHRITHALFVPTTIVQLCDQVAAEPADLSSLRLLVYGASPIGPEVLRRAMRLLPCGFVQHYGMTETHGCTMLLPGDHDPVGHPERLASAGTVSRSYEVRVVDADDADVGPGITGEVVCRGPAVMDGYWNRPEDTAAALRNGWMHTGDMGHMDGDGFLYITDRLKDVIVSGGENIYPREVEDVLYEHASVMEATVIGIPDERWGEAAHALVVPRGAPPSVDTLLAHCRERIAAYKVPRRSSSSSRCRTTPSAKSSSARSGNATGAVGPAWSAERGRGRAGSCPPRLTLGAAGPLAN
jgi:acyl-CoA synthetase (AMP-forming)/AMP-acid ligase II